MSSDVPTLHVSGWYDDVLVGTTENYVNLTTRGARDKQWLLIGPWGHRVNTRRVGAMDFGPEATIDFDALQLRWFDHWLKGTVTASRAIRRTAF